MNSEDPFVDRLSDYLDDELNDADRAAVEMHLRSCDGCKTLLGELRAVATRAAALPDTAPDADLWPGLAARIGGRDARGAQVMSFRPVTPARRFSFTMPQIVAASLALMLLSGGIVWMARSGDPRTDLPSIAATGQTDALEVTPANFAEPQYDEAIADLEQILEKGRAKLDPETVRVLEANLEAIDRAIDQCRRALAADPANAYLNSHLASARQRKLSLLRRASALAVAGS